MKASQALATSATTLTLAAATLTAGLAPMSVSASGTAAPIAVDTRDIAYRRLSAPADLTYSPYWLAQTDGAGRASRIEVVTDPESANPVTNTLVTTENGAESLYAWTPETGVSTICRLLHWTLDGGAPTGMPLVCDAVIGSAADAGTMIGVDSRTNSLQEAVSVGKTLELTYSPIWGDGLSVRLERIRQRTNPLSETTTDLLQSEDGVESVYAMGTSCLPSGHYILRHITLDNASQQVGEILTAEFDIQRPQGTIVSLY